MSEAATVTPGRQRMRRTLNESLDVRQTHLVIRRGPVMAVCVHKRLGLFMGRTHDKRLMWSHDQDTLDLLAFHHPDASRVTVSWPTQEMARNQLLQWLAFDDWSMIAIKSAHSDVCEAPPADADPSIGPTLLCSIENCIRLVPGLVALDVHMLDPDTQTR